jgi:FkbM family methyltransferase
MWKGSKTKMKFQLRPETSDKCVIEQSKTYFKHIKPKKTDVWLDIGANIGCFSCLIAPKVKQVIAYEPELDNFSMLVTNIKLNQLKNVQPVMSAIVGKDDTTRTLYAYADGYKSCHSLIRHNPVKGKRIKLNVFCENIRSIIGRYGINKIKMDVEGAEKEILNELLRLFPIQKRRGKIVYANNFLDELIFEYHWGILKTEKLTKKSKSIKHLNKIFKHISIADEGFKTQLVYARR